MTIVKRGKWKEVIDRFGIVQGEYVRSEEEEKYEQKWFDWGTGHVVNENGICDGFERMEER